MIETYLRQNALAHLGLEGREPSSDAAVRLHEKSLPTAVNLRGEKDDPTFLEAVNGALGLGLPVEPNTAAQNETLAILWLGPNEWLLVRHDVSPEAEAQLSASLRDALGDIHSAVTEVGESLVCIHISGPRAADVIAKGCPLDLHPSAFGGAGHCAQSHLSKTAITLHQLSNEDEGGPDYDLYTRRSFADYLWRWLSDAAREYSGG
ncbi:sarcosine oxidase subunit gamma [Pelagibius litoralis]|uniref:Sarcosine oxidase subunit gamma n=1 Tax=Pelagibius litoralis TaxID=374515 RepID=A0A967C273_9PROT|nr:sarcosine oxidase subunit gamma family protein [Pelagibius litoralis]NIA68926.1 sarcosine oxidase subunit gamma [Pelagibius litoralis]